MKRLIPILCIQHLNKWNTQFTQFTRSASNRFPSTVKKAGVDVLADQPRVPKRKINLITLKHVKAANQIDLFHPRFFVKTHISVEIYGIHLFLHSGGKSILTVFNISPSTLREMLNVLSFMAYFIWKLTLIHT